MKVPFSYLDRQFRFAAKGKKPELADLILEDIKKFVGSGDFTLGGPLQEFERRFAKLIGAKHAIGVNSGTDALFLSLKALGIGPGDEVITCAETFIATAGAIAQAGAKPVFVDADERYLLDLDRVEAAITPKTKALMPVYFTGDCPDMSRVLELAKKHRLKVVEDSCCAIDASVDGKKAGAWGDAAGFSFHPLKNLNVWSDGGMITTSSDETAAKLRLLRNHGLKNRDEVEVFGYNTRLDTLEAVVGLRLLDGVKEVTDRRIAVAKRYDEAFSSINGLVVPPRRAGARHVFHLYMVRAKDRDALLAHCKAAGVDAKVHYPIPLPYQKCCASLGYRKGDFPRLERDCASIISFPAHQHLTDDEVDYVIETVRSFYK